MIKTFLLLLLLVVTVLTVVQKNNQKLVVYFSVFSLVAASLYFYSHAPDVALAEIAVGSAFIPLIFLIAISKQRTFTVLLNGLENFVYQGLMEEFCLEENLKLKILNADEVDHQEAKSVSGVFRRFDVDMIIDYSPKKKKYYLLCKSDNKLIDRFEKKVHGNHKIRLIRHVDEVTLD